ncbi:MAG: hypothetical protein RR817_08750 [Niameybacter sp.]
MMGLAQIFEDCLLPLAVEGGKCLFYITCVSGIYVLIRGNASESIKKIKTATIGYILLRTIKNFVDLIDRIADTIQF